MKSVLISAVFVLASLGCASKRQAPLLTERLSPNFAVVTNMLQNTVVSVSVDGSPVGELDQSGRFVPLYLHMGEEKQIDPGNRVSGRKAVFRFHVCDARTGAPLGQMYEVLDFRSNEYQYYRYPGAYSMGGYYSSGYTYGGYYQPTYYHPRPRRRGPAYDIRVDHYTLFEDGNPQRKGRPE
jgi:hypothetical protein